MTYVLFSGGKGELYRSSAPRRHELMLFLGNLPFGDGVLGGGSILPHPLPITLDRIDETSNGFPGTVMINLHMRPL